VYRSCHDTDDYAGPWHLRLLTYAEVSKEGRACSFKFVHRRRIFLASYSRIAKSAASHFFYYNGRKKKPYCNYSGNSSIGALFSWNAHFSFPVIIPLNFYHHRFWQHTVRCELNKLLSKFTLQSLTVTIRTIGFNIHHFHGFPQSACMCVLCVFQNCDFFPCTTLSDWFLKPSYRVFTARYNLYL
jgi:hypothetical protein